MRKEIISERPHPRFVTAGQLLQSALTIIWDLGFFFLLINSPSWLSFSYFSSPSLLLFLLFSPLFPSSFQSYCQVLSDTVGCNSVEFFLFSFFAPIFSPSIFIVIFFPFLFFSSYSLSFSTTHLLLLLTATATEGLLLWQPGSNV